MSYCDGCVDWSDMCAAKDAEIEALTKARDRFGLEMTAAREEREQLRHENKALLAGVEKFRGALESSNAAAKRRGEENEALRRQRNEWKGYCTGMREEIRVAQAERDAAIHDREDLKRHLGSLLAVIHRDGGHYQSTHGDAASSRDAETTFLALLQENEILRRQRDEWMKISHAWEDDVTKLREENETNRKNFIAALNAASDLAINGILAEVTRLRLENESLKRERDQIAEELGYYNAIKDADPSSDAFLDTCEDLETLRASAQSLIFTTRTLQKRAERERDEFKKAFTQADKDAINALWNFDPEIPYTAGGSGPGFVIDIFRTHLQVARATIAEQANEIEHLRYSPHDSFPELRKKVVEQAKLVGQLTQVLLKFHPMWDPIIRYGCCAKCGNYEYCETADLLYKLGHGYDPTVARALEAKEGTK